MFRTLIRGSGAGKFLMLATLVCKQPVISTEMGFLAYDLCKMLQIELVHAQLKRAKGRSDTHDMELFMDAMLAISEKDDTKALCQVAEKLQLKSPSQLKTEAHAVQNLIKERNGVVDESLKQILGLLRRLTLLINEADTELDSLELEKLSFYDVADGENPQSPVVPNDFRCPISLELMKDPVIVATGQVSYL